MFKLRIDGKHYDLLEAVWNEDQESIETYIDKVPELEPYRMRILELGQLYDVLYAFSVAQNLEDLKNILLPDNRVHDLHREPELKGWWTADAFEATVNKVFSPRVPFFPLIKDGELEVVYVYLDLRHYKEDKPSKELTKRLNSNPHSLNSHRKITK